MHDLSDLLSPSAVFIDVTAANKKQLLTQLAAAAEPLFGIAQGSVADRLMARERLGSTGFGGGVAIPHAKIAGLPAVSGMFARLAVPIAFDAVDDLPVDMVFVLLSPTEAGADHLKALARVSRRLRDEHFLGKLRGAASRDALYALFTADMARDAA